MIDLVRLTQPAQPAGAPSGPRLVGDGFAALLDGGLSPLLSGADERQDVADGGSDLPAADVPASVDPAAMPWPDLANLMPAPNSVPEVAPVNAASLPVVPHRATVSPEQPPAATSPAPSTMPAEAMPAVDRAVSGAPTPRMPDPSPLRTSQPDDPARPNAGQETTPAPPVPPRAPASPIRTDTVPADRFANVRDRLLTGTGMTVVRPLEPAPPSRSTDAVPAAEFAPPPRQPAKDAVGDQTGDVPAATGPFPSSTGGMQSPSGAVRAASILPVGMEATLPKADRSLDDVAPDGVVVAAAPRSPTAAKPLATTAAVPAMNAPAERPAQGPVGAATDRIVGTPVTDTLRVRPAPAWQFVRAAAAPFERSAPARIAMPPVRVSLSAEPPVTGPATAPPAIQAMVAPEGVVHGLSEVPDTPAPAAGRTPRVEIAPVRVEPLSAATSGSAPPSTDAEPAIDAALPEDRRVGSDPSAGTGAVPKPSASSLAETSPKPEGGMRQHVAARDEAPRSNGDTPAPPENALVGADPYEARATVRDAAASPVDRPVPGPELRGEGAMPAPLPAPAAPTGAPAPGTAAAMLERPPLDPRGPRFPESLVEIAETLRDAGGEVRETRIRLTPDALGSVDVRLTREGDGLRVHLVADNPQAARLLADAQPRLTEMAEQRGLRLAGGGTDGHGQPGSDRAPRQDQQAPRPRPARFERPSAPVADDTRIA